MEGKLIQAVLMMVIFAVNSRGFKAVSGASHAGAGNETHDEQGRQRYISYGGGGRGIGQCFSVEGEIQAIH